MKNVKYERICVVYYYVYGKKSYWFKYIYIYHSENNGRKKNHRKNIATNLSTTLTVSVRDSQEENRPEKNSGTLLSHWWLFLVTLVWWFQNYLTSVRKIELTGKYMGSQGSHFWSRGLYITSDTVEEENYNKYTVPKYIILSMLLINYEGRKWYIYMSKLTDTPLIKISKTTSQYWDKLASCTLW